MSRVEPAPAGDRQKEPRWSWFQVALLAVGSAALVIFGVGWAISKSGASPIWLASGLAVWGVFRGGRRACWGVAVGTALGQMVMGAPLVMAAAGAVGSTGEAVIGLWLLVRVRRWWQPLGDAEEADILGVIAAAAVAPFWSVGWGVSAAYGLGMVQGGDVLRQVLTWWLGNFLGILILLPLLQTGLRSDEKGVGRAWSGLAVLIVALVTLWVLFVDPRGGDGVFLVFPVLLLAVQWGGRLGGRLFVLLVLGFALGSAGAGRGPFVTINATDGLLRLYVFLAVFVVTAWVLPMFRRRGNFRLPGAILLVGWVLSGAIYVHERSRAELESAHRLGTLVRSAEGAFAQRMAVYVDALRAGKGLFDASETVSRTEWRKFAGSLLLAERYPGINGIGVIWPVREADRVGWVETMQEDGWPGFAVKAVPDVPAPVPAPGEAEHYVIGFIEPESVNAEAIGLDVGSETNRRRAADIARDTGHPQVTRRIVLVQDGERRAGFLLFVPVYTSGPTPATVEERRARFRHWIYAPFITELFMQGVLPDQDAELALDFFEGESFDPADLLYSSAIVSPRAYDASSKIELSGETFTFGWSRTAMFAAPDASLPIWMGSGLAVASLLLAGLVTLLQRSGQRARELTEERTRELAETQENLHRVVSLQQGVLDGNAFAIISTDLTGRIEIFNHGAEQMLGYTRDEVVGRMSPEAFFSPPELRERAQAFVVGTDRPPPEGFALFIALVEQKETDETEWTFVRRDGELVPVQQTLSAIGDAAGHISGYLFIGQDVSARKLAESDRRAAQSELAAFKVALDHYVAMSISTVNGRIVYGNDQFCSISGYPREVLIGESFSLLKSGVHPPEFFAELWQKVQAGEIWRGAICNRTRDGEHCWLDTLIFPELGENGRPRRYITLQIDITATKLLEENLEAARDEAMALSRLKSEFLANMSHELRTPMNGVIGMAELLADTVTDPECRQMVAIIRSSGENLLTIINDVLDFSKIEAGKLRMVSADFELRSMLQEVLGLLGAGATAKQLALREDAFPPEPVRLCGDEGRLRQVVTNLVGNAIKFTEAGEVSVSLLINEVGPGGVDFRVEVRDTGIGIPPATQARLFQAFVQADGSDRRQFGGTGLGLAISRQIIELMGGRIGVESDVGRGSVFWFELCLPAATGEVVKRDEPAPPPRAVRELNLLLVDDNPINRRVGRMLLEGIGHRIEVAVDGRDALERLARRVFDVVLMDCQMPVMDGFEATRKIRSGAVAGIDPRVPVIALTAYVKEGDRQRCLDAGMNEHLTKPLRRTEVAAVLNRFGHLGDASDLSANEGETGSDPVLDADVCAELFELGGAAVFASIAENYLDTTSAEMTILRRAWVDRDWEILGSRAHGLGSGAAAFGGVALRTRCLRLEQAAHGGEVEVAEKLLNEVDADIASLRTAVAEAVARGSAR